MGLGISFKRKKMRCLIFRGRPIEYRQALKEQLTLMSPKLLKLKPQGQLQLSRLRRKFRTLIYVKLIKLLPLKKMKSPGFKS